MDSITVGELIELLQKFEAFDDTLPVTIGGEAIMGLSGDKGGIYLDVGE